MTLHRSAFALALAVACIATARAAELLGPGVISTGLQETSAAFAPDGQTVFFLRSDLAEKDDTIMMSRQRNGHWSMPEVAPFSGQWHDSEPSFSPSCSGSSPRWW